MEILEVGKEVLAEFLAQEWEAYDQENFGGSTRELWRITNHSLVAYEGDRVVGGAVFKIEAGVGKLDELLVARRERGKGVGSKLLTRFEEMCGAAGCHKVRLVTLLSSPAPAFYEKHGYRVEATLRRDMLGRDWAIMAKFLNSR